MLGDSSALTMTSVFSAAFARCSAPRMSSKKCGLAMSEITIAMVLCRPDCSACACGLAT